MGDRFSMSVGLAHDLELAFRRTGWEDAEEVKKLASGETLRLVREVVLGRADIHPRETAVSVPAPPKPLLEPIGTIVIPATTEQFIVRERFVVGTDQKARVKISYLGDNFRDRFLDKIEEPAAEATLRYAMLRRSSWDAPILAELKDTAETTLSQMFWLMERQSNGERGTLLNNGRANIFYILDAAGVLRAVFTFWYGDGWGAYARAVGSPRAWGDGYRVFSRNFSVAVAA